MTVKLTLEQVRHVARLACLELSDVETEALRVDLSSILQHVASLDRLDVSAVEPTAQVTELIALLRPDRVVPSLPREEFLASAKESELGGFAVPKVLDGD